MAPQRWQLVVNFEEEPFFQISKKIPPFPLNAPFTPEKLLQCHHLALQELHRILVEGEMWGEEESEYSLLDLKRELLWHQAKYCELCLHKCQIDRTTTTRGKCGLDLSSLISFGRLEEEWITEISPCYALYFPGCNFQCLYCNTWETSFYPERGNSLNLPQVVAEIQEAFDQGARSIKFTGGEPLLHLHSILDILKFLEVHIAVVAHTNFFIPESLFPVLVGIFDLLIVDVKFGSDECARSLAGISPYSEWLWNNIRRYPADLYLRHICLPGHINCCTIPILKEISRLPFHPPFQVLLNYVPEYKGKHHSLLNRTLLEEEKEQVREAIKNILGG
ncbi:MAG: radical SAM protein [bacterium JZ-2024 1]